MALIAQKTKIHGFGKTEKMFFVLIVAQMLTITRKVFAYEKYKGHCTEHSSKGKTEKGGKAVMN